MFATRRKEAKAVDRVILHIDMNNFYASVETLYDPSLKDIPMAVGGDKERRHGIVLAKNMLAKAKGVKTAEALWEAERKCPGIKFVPPHFERYAKYSRLAKEIYMQYTDMVESGIIDPTKVARSVLQNAASVAAVCSAAAARLRRKFARASKMSSGSRCQSACRSTKFSQSSAATIKSRMP